MVVCFGGRWADGLVVVLGYFRSLPWWPHVPVGILDFEIWEGGGWIGGGSSYGCGVRCWIWFCLCEHPFSVGTLFPPPPGTVALLLAVWACCLKMCMSWLMAFVVMFSCGTLPAKADVKLSAAQMIASAVVSVGMVRYLCLKNTVLQVRVCLVSLM